MKYAEALERAKTIHQGLRADDPRFLRAVKVSFVDGSAVNYRDAFLLELDDYLFIFTEHFGCHVEHKDEVQHQVQYAREIPVAQIGQEVWTLYGIIEEVRNGVAQIKFVDATTQGTAYRTEADAEILQSLYGIHHRFRMTVMGDAVFLEPQCDEAVPPEKVPGFISQFQASLTNITEDTDG
jgi:hypothetical protein